MANEFHRPALFDGSAFEAFQGGEDPATINRVAHETAGALLSRVRDDPQPEVIERLLAYTDDHGIDAVAELWARASAHSLPGSLWRIYLLRVLIRQDAEMASYFFERGTEVMAGIDPVVAGAESPTGPKEITDLADQILRGLFTGDFAIALERAAAFCRIMAQGCASIADDAEIGAPETASTLTTRALRFETIGDDLSSSAALWRHDGLD
ncbi:DNA-directed RNA polymerase subunit beta [Herbiconiux sp. KACC 21604]|uniref:DNA-directed RNA polymerase subunit beta n=1 Tax=unclassified Herbiconiux TaxID=2618217 RepID=UPI001490E152|nr:DNA-directed RNA polymerase subunit beta [Herbiconiux sp. SALV-R1]QJU52499.1 DNA-directed RNA polymerase subunit beta [Herbiconiux sp. SALV-R1]WPO87374.1 DNA-directed RNA polymerase subunit beta [Herbiconiux sp. KACC 21604]